MSRPPEVTLPDGQVLPLQIVRHRRARRYLLRLRPDGSARLTLPRWGNQSEGLAFVGRHHAWLQQQRERLRQQAQALLPWVRGTEIWFRGEPARLEMEPGDDGVTLRFADQSLHCPAELQDYRPILQQHLRRLASGEFPNRVRQLAEEHRVTHHRVTVRDQRSRWGSCSVRGTISLNWRLIQAPPLVLDYVIVHELMHRRQMNHSARFWQEVAAAFPRHAEARLWLRRHADRLR